MDTGSVYIAIDLKSFYASVECVDRGLDPLRANLVVADSSRTDKTICLAVSPSLKAMGIPGRPRLFEVIQKVRRMNAEHPAHTISYITAPPRMARYMEVSTSIYEIYLHYVAPEDIHVYSIDEVFLDVTSYLSTYHMSARELAMTMIRDVLSRTGITATAGIGTNLYLAKVAMDIVAKHAPPDQDGVRIAELDEYTYRRLLWDHEPITDFWRVGPGYARRLQQVGLSTMGDIARCSIGEPGSYYNEELLYRLFGVNAELLIDHAWGYEPCTIAQIKAYRPRNHSVGSGQVLPEPCSHERARLIVKEMADQLSLDLVEKELVTDQLVLTISYDRENLSGHNADRYHGPVTTDHYGRKVPGHAHGTGNLSFPTSSSRLITKEMAALYDRITDPALLVRRITMSACHVIRESGDVTMPEPEFEQLTLFTDYEKIRKKRAKERENLLRERKLQQAALSIRKKYGKNAVLKGMNLLDGATARERNCQIGGHKA
ncbi:MAG: DNA methylase [Lachnospiraceae bacterium]|nr:DNA methylase [Lachnospiraceae bacterium]